jgi:predicted O-methyltransferase YrrM
LGTFEATVATVGVAWLALSALTCLLAAYLVYKLRQVHRTLYGTDYVVKTMSRNLSQSLQNLDLLRHELQLDQPLPPLRGWAASPDVLLLMVRHVKRTAPAVILECGSGASTVVLAQAARLNGRGHVYSVDHDGAYVEESRALLARYGLSDWATITHAPLREVAIDGARWEWYDPDRLPQTPPVDLLFVDGPPADTPKPLARYPAGPMLFPLLSSHGVVFADDTGRPGEIEVLRRWASAFPLLTQHAHFCEKGCHELWVDRQRADGMAAAPAPEHLPTPERAMPRRALSS